MTSWLGAPRSRRSAGARGPWILVLILAALAGCTAIGCSDADGDYSGAARSVDDPAPAQPAPPPPDDGGSSVPRVYAVMAWAQANGPVDGYRVFVEWNGSATFVPHEDVPSAAVVIEGDVGERIRMQVAALDAAGVEGPRSPPSKEILFTTRMPPANGSSAASLAAARPASAAEAGEEDSRDARRDARSETSDTEPEADDESLAAAPGVRGDLTGDGRADLLWESRDGTRLRITGPDLAAWLELGRPGADWTFVGQGDFDLDGRSDLWWQNEDGEVAVTRGALLLTQPTHVPLEPWAKLGPDERIERVADYDGDGLADALVGTAANGEGDATLWLTRESVFELAPVVAPETDARRVAVTGDLDGDGNEDLLWALDSGDLLVQFLVRGRVDGAAALPPMQVAGAEAADPLASLDLDGTGEDRLVFRESTRLVTRDLHGASQGWDVALPETAALIGCADYDGDGSDDLLWSAGDALQFVYLPGAEVATAEAGWTPLPLCR